MKKNEHETLREKFWDWWEYTSLEEMVISGLVLVIVTAVAVVLTAFVVWLFMQMFGSNDLPADEPAEGVGRNPAVVRYLSPSEAEEIGTAYLLDEYTEGEYPVPAWWNPDEEMAVVWSASCQQVAGKLDEVEPHPPAGIDRGGIDWNLCSTMYGAHGLTAEPWELDLMARIVSRECCGCSRVCWEAIADSILRRVESGYWGDSIYSVLSAVEENGAWAYTTWPDVWNGEIELYDEIRAVCEERFYAGAEWDAMWFNLYDYADWAIPMYEIDGVYFSQSPWVNGGSEG